MPVALLPPPVSHSAAAATAAAATSAAPGPNPEAVHGASATPEAERELWEMELHVRAYGKWSSGRMRASSAPPGSLKPLAPLPAPLLTVGFQVSCY